ncbi:MAG: hypothetical protein ACYCX7_07715 [Solirubrobacteraceae bacterium]
MSLRFLTASPVARSPLAAGVAAAGGILEEHDGWEVAVRFADPDAERVACRETVGWCDVSHRRKLELQGAPATLAHASSQEGIWLAVTPQRVLLLDGQAWPQTDAYVLDITSQLAAIAIVGPLARELFARFCSLDLRPHVTPPGTLRPGSVARVPGYVLCEGPDRYVTMFGAAYGDYVWTVVSDAGAHLGGCPVGLQALLASEVASRA